MNQSIKTLEAYNAWRKGGGRSCIQTNEIGIAIDDCVQAAKRYEVLRELTLTEFHCIYHRSLGGENFDALIDELVKARKK